MNSFIDRGSLSCRVMLSGYQSGLTPMHFAAVIDKDLYETLESAGGDCHTVDIEGNDPE